MSTLSSLYTSSSTAYDSCYAPCVSISSHCAEPASIFSAGHQVHHIHSDENYGEASSYHHNNNNNSVEDAPIPPAVPAAGAPENNPLDFAKMLQTIGVIAMGAFTALSFVFVVVSTSMWPISALFAGAAYLGYEAATVGGNALENLQCERFHHNVASRVHTYTEGTCIAKTLLTWKPDLLPCLNLA